MSGHTDDFRNEEEVPQNAASRLARERTNCPPSAKFLGFKRIADVALATLALIVLAPLLFVCAGAVKLTSPGPVLFRQERWGHSWTKFECLKFRTMVVNTPQDLTASEFTDKERYMTSCGNVLRRWSLDELPQLINIIKGDMSIVGPRPVIIRERSLVEKREERNANTLRPGLTGWAQVNGRNLVDDDEKAALDGEYAENMSLAFDLKILAKTIVVVVSKRGIDRASKSDPERTRRSA